MCDQQRLRPACAYVQSDQSLSLSLEYSMSVKLLTEHHLEFLSLKGGCAGLSESTHVKLPHCWKSRVTAHMESGKICKNNDRTYLLLCINTCRSLGRCLNTRSNGTRKMLSMKKPVIPIIYSKEDLFWFRFCDLKINIYNINNITNIAHRASSIETTQNNK